MATGNDWRAIEAGANTYACKDGQYRGLSTWTFDEEAQVLRGQLTFQCQSQHVVAQLVLIQQ